MRSYSRTKFEQHVFFGFPIYIPSQSLPEPLTPNFSFLEKIFVCHYDCSPAVSKESLKDVGGTWCAKDGPFDTSVLEIAAIDLLGTEPLFDSLLNAVTLGKAHRARSRGETVVHKVHGVLDKNKGKRETAEVGKHLMNV